MVVTHEWGHQFGSGHTRNNCEYEPIVDGCGSRPDNQPCEAGVEDCSVGVARKGTITSYGHLCDRGIANIKLTLGPRVGARIADFAANASCVVSRTPPSVTSILASTSADACSGEPITLAAQASGDALRSQWFRNGARIAGAVDASYTIASPVAGDEWDVLVYSPCGSIFTRGVTLTIQAVGLADVGSYDCLVSDLWHQRQQRHLGRRGRRLSRRHPRRHLRLLHHRRRRLQ